MKQAVLILLSAGLAVGATACTTIHELGIPSAQFDAIKFDHVEISAASQEARLNVVLRFLVDNPTGTRLMIPRHDFGVLMGLAGQPESQMTQVHADTKALTTVPAGGQAIIDYVIPLSLSPITANRALAYLGHDAVYQFQATVDLGVLNPPAGAPTLKHRGRVRLPLPPRIVADGVPSFEFVGGLEQINLIALKSMMQPAVSAIASFGAEHIPGLGSVWTDFLTAFNRLNAVINYPGPSTEGVRITAPVRVINQNHFDIELPSFATTAGIVGTSNPVLDLRLTPGSGAQLNRAQRTIPALGSKRLNAVTTARWKDLADGLPQILRPGGLSNVQLSGSVSADLGYGPVKITYP
jgi:hypothetical protein